MWWFIGRSYADRLDNCACADGCWPHEGLTHVLEIGERSRLRSRLLPLGVGVD